MSSCPACPETPVSLEVRFRRDDGCNPAVLPSGKGRQPERACCGKSGKKGGGRGAERSVQDYQRCGRGSLFRPHRCPDAKAAHADEAGWSLGKGLEEPSRQNCS